MTTKPFIIAAVGALSVMPATAQKDITPQMLQQFQNSYKSEGADKALDNAVAANDIKVLALNNETMAQFDTEFSNKVNSKGVTNQRGSGRCWLFSGLNVLRAKMIAKYNLGAMEFSENYCFFYDQLEKSNLFLQAVIDNGKKPMDDRTSRASCRLRRAFLLSSPQLVCRSCRRQSSCAG